MDDATTLQLALGSELVLAPLYVWGGVRIARRLTRPTSQRAGAMFVLFWFGVAATGLLSAAQLELSKQGASPPLIDTLAQAALFAYAAGLAGFTSYVAAIYLGSSKADRVILPVYAALVLWSWSDALVHPATRYHMENWRPILGRDASFGPPPALAATLLSVPLLVGTVAYATLARKAEDAPTRRRIALVTGALLAWLAGAIAVSVSAAVAAQLGGRAILLASSVLLVIAYAPRRPTSAREASSRELADRVRQLV